MAGVNGHAVIARQLATSFDPLTLSPFLWYDFSDAATITLNGSNVSQANDKSGNNRYVAQGTAGSQPAYTSAGQNGLNVVTFDGSNDDLRLASAVSLAQPFVVYAVVKNTANGGTSANVMSSTGGSGAYLYRAATTNYWAMYAGSAAASTTANNLGVHLLTAVFNGASSSLRLDGSSIGSGNPGTGGFSSEIMILGRDNSAGSVFAGFMGEFLIDNGTSTVSTAYEAALKAKWGTP